MKKKPTKLKPGDLLRGCKGPRRIVRLVWYGAWSPAHNDFRHRVEALLLDSDGVLRYASWDAAATVTTMETP